jgi:hypothetical protein
VVGDGFRPDFRYFFIVELAGMPLTLPFREFGT